VSTRGRRVWKIERKSIWESWSLHSIKDNAIRTAKRLDHGYNWRLKRPYYVFRVRNIDTGEIEWSSETEVKP